MESLLNPADYMKKMLSLLSKPTSTSTDSPSISISMEQTNGFYIDDLMQKDSYTLEEKEEILYNLESLLSDIDNSRDFKTIGGWPILVNLFHSSSPHLSLRSLATWITGTAIKSSYDYQLWLLEPLKIRYSISNDLIQEDETTGLEILLENFSNEIKSLLELNNNIELINNNNDDLKKEKLLKIKYLKNLLYTFSSLSNGNLDTQFGFYEYNLRSNSELFINPILKLLEKTENDNDYIDIHKKIWTFASDILSNNIYINAELEDYKSSAYTDLNNIQIKINSTIDSDKNPQLIQLLNDANEKYLSIKYTQESNLFYKHFLKQEFFLLALKQFTKSINILNDYYIKELNNNINRSYINTSRSILKNLFLYFQSYFILLNSNNNNDIELMLKSFNNNFFVLLSKEINFDDDNELILFMKEYFK